MANQKKSQQAKKIEAMGAKSGATKAQVAQGLARAGGKSSYNVTNKDIKKAGKAAKIIAGAAVTAVGPGKVVKGVQTAAKVAKVAKATKAATKAKETAKTAKVASNSVKVKPANKTDPSNERININRSSNLRMIKSGKIAKGEAQGVELKNRVFNPKPKVIKINSNKK